MATEDNRIIRIILEGRDNLSGSFKNARKNINDELGKIKNDVRKARGEFEKDERTSLIGNKGPALRGPGGRFATKESLDRDAASLTKSLRALKGEANSVLDGMGDDANRINNHFRSTRDLIKEAVRLFNTQKTFKGVEAITSPKPPKPIAEKGFFGQFAEAAKEAKSIGDEIEAALSQEKDAVKERRRIVDEETRRGQDLLNDRKNALKRENDERQDVFKKELNTQIDNAKLIQRAVNDVRENSFKKFQAKEIRARDERIRAARAEAEKIVIPNSIARKAESAKSKPDPVIVQRLNDVIKGAQQNAKLVENIENQATAARIKAREQADSIIKQREKQAIEEEFRQRRNARAADAEDAKNAVIQQNSFAQQEFNKERGREVDKVKAPDERSVRERILGQRRLRDETSGVDRVFQKLGRTTGRWLGDFRRGAVEGRAGIADFSKEVQALESRMTRLGQRVGRLVGQFGNLVNLRWFFLTSAIQLVGTLITQLGAAFISLAGSAAYAGAAIGAAFAAAASQALPVLGLFAAASARVKSVFKAVQLHNQNAISAPTDQTAQLKAQREATEGVADSQYSLKQAYLAVGDAQYAVRQGALSLADAQYAVKQASIAVRDAQYDLKKAHQGVTDAQYDQKKAVQGIADAQYDLKTAIRGVIDAQYGFRQSQIAVTTAIEQQKDAVRNLAQTRIDVSRGVVDSYLAERQAAISLRDAELGILDAKRQLLQEEKNQKNNQADINAAKGAIKEAQERLAAARKAQDQFGIADASAQLAQAKQGLNAIEVQAQTTNTAVAEAKQNVKQAILDKDKANVDNKRTKEDSAKLQKQGINNNQQVIAAQRQVRDATRSVADARHSEAQAERAITDAKRQRVIAERGVRDARHQEVLAERGVVDARRQEVISERNVADARHQQRIAERGVGDAKHQQLLNERGLADARHALAIAERELKDAESDRKQTQQGQIASAKQLQNLLKQLTPSERNLYNSVLKLQTAYKKAFRPITDIIVNAFSRAVDKAVLLLQDPRLLKAATGLAHAIAHAIDRISDFTISPKFRSALKTFFDNAAGNLPKVVDAFLNLADAFVTLAKIGTPLFGRFVDFLDRASRRLDKFLNSKKAAKDFFGVASSSLDDFIQLGTAIGRVVLLLLKGSQPAGHRILDDLTDFFNRIANWLKDHPKQVNDFFLRMAENLERIGGALDELGPILFKAFTSKSANDFTVFLLEVVIPALLLVTQTIQLVTQGIQFLIGLPVVGQFIKWAVEFAIAEKALNKIFPVSQLITNALKGLGRVLLGLVIPALKLLRLALLAVFEGNPIALAIIGIIIALVLLDRKFHFIKPALEAIKKAAIATFDWFRKNWRQLPQIIAHPFIVAYDAVKKFFGQQLPEAVIGFVQWIRTKANVIATAIGTPFVIAYNAIKRFFTKTIPATVNGFIDWFRNHWKVIAAIAIAIFLPGGAIVLAVIHWRKAIIGEFKAIIDWVRAHWKDIVSIIVAIFTFPAGTIAVAILRWHSEVLKSFRKLISGIVGFFSGLGTKIVNAIKGIPDQIVDVFKDVGTRIAKKITGGIGGVVKKGLGILGIGGDNNQPSPQDIAQAALKGPGHQRDIVKAFLAHPDAPPTLNFLKSLDATTRKKIRTAKFKAGGIVQRFMTGGIVQNVQQMVPPDKVKEIASNFKASGAKAYAGGGIVQKALQAAKGAVGTDTVPAMLTPGEWVVTEKQQSKLAQRLGATKDGLVRFLFGSDGVPELFKAKGKTPGLIQEGNIDINHRPVAHNDDGTISTVRSITITDNKGRAYLIPTVIDGKVVSNTKAIDHFNVTHENLGFFSNENAADSYGIRLHEQQAKYYEKGPKVPAMLTPGEWVVTKAQQNKIAKQFGQAPDQVARYLFGTRQAGQPGDLTGTKISNKYEAFQGPDFVLVPHQDTDGTTVWFIEFADKTFGQVGTKDANKIIESNGNYLPKYALRHGPLELGKMRKLKAKSKVDMNHFNLKPSYGLGGAGGGVQFRSGGGPIMSSPSGQRPSGNTVHQNFNVNVQGDTDWNYAMRLGAIHATESY